MWKMLLGHNPLWQNSVVAGDGETVAVTQAPICAVKSNADSSPVCGAFTAAANSAGLQSSTASASEYMSIGTMTRPK